MSKFTAQNQTLDLSALISEKEWNLQRAAIAAAQERGLRFALGGGLAFSAYAGRWRNTKDLDLYVLPEERAAMIAIVTDAGFGDYYEKEPYDRKWIYRAYREDVILDLIWELANHHDTVKETWLRGEHKILIHGFRLPLLPVEELIWSKLFVFQHERCDWVDILNIIYARGDEIDWKHLLNLVGEDAPLLGAVVQIFSWLCPAEARQLPSFIWEKLEIGAPREDFSCRMDKRRVRLLDSRDWFGETTDADNKI